MKKIIQKLRLAISFLEWGDWFFFKNVNEIKYLSFFTIVKKFYSLLDSPASHEGHSVQATKNELVNLKGEKKHYYIQMYLYGIFWIMICSNFSGLQDTFLTYSPIKALNLHISTSQVKSLLGAHHHKFNSVQIGWLQKKIFKSCTPKGRIHCKSFTLH